MKKASISEAKNGLSALLDQVKNGETIVITDRGRPVARLEPVGAAESDDERVARLVRAGILRPAPHPGASRVVFKKPPIKLKKGYSALQALLDEREEGR